MIYILVSGDWHAGHPNGILVPGTVLNEKDPPRERSNAQQTVWNVTQNVMTYTERIAGDAPIIIIQGGDVTHGHKYQEYLTSGKPSHQMIIAMRYLEEIGKRLNVSAFYSVRGTDAHTDDSSTEEMLAEYIRDKLGVTSVAVSHLGLTVSGVRLDVAHEGPMTGRAWTAGNPVRNYLRRQMAEDMDTLNRTPPDLYFRFHVHGFGDESDKLERGGKYCYSRIIVCPSMCVANGYARSITRAQSFYRLGMILVGVDDGIITLVKPLLQTFTNISDFTYSPGVVASPYKGSPRPGVSKRLKEMWEKRRQ